MEVLSRGLFARTESESQAQAVALAQELLEDFRDRAHNATAFASITTQSTAPISGFPSFTRDIRVSFPLGTSGNNARLKRVDLTVAWQVQGNTFTTYLSSFIMRP